MAFQSLVGGPECGTSANPLARVLKHADGDRSLQQDRISGPSTSRLHQLPTTSGQAQANEQDLAIARQFFDAGGQNHAFAPPHPAELARMNEIHGGPLQQHMTEHWTLEHQHQPMKFNDSAQGGWAAEFGTAPQANGVSIAAQGPVAARPTFQPQTSYMSPMGAYARPLAFGMGAPQQFNSFMPVNAKGKGKEVDYDAAFAQFAEETATSTSRIEEVDEVTDALRNTTLEPETKEETDDVDFKRVWESLQDSDLPPAQEDMAKWEAEFSQLMNAQRDELEDYGSNMQRAWEGGLGNIDAPLDTKPMQFDPEGIPLLGDYVFEQNNPYLASPPSGSLLAEAKALLENNGSLSEAALMLEAAIQRGELGEGGYEAWILLGETRNMDEREEAGMRALLQGVQKAQEANASGAGMLSLAISFTNEAYDRASHTMLLRWFRARYPDVAVPPETIKAVGTNSSWDTHGRITELFIDLARTQHAKNEMDPELQIGLGVLFYTNGDYERAQDCFVTALNVRPKDYLLWNRLGSSLSNGNKPEEALGAYREALQLRPTYTRAIYNVGVACLNIGADKEAAEHFLTALSLQETTNGDTSNQLWFTLRRALLSMGRGELAELAKPELKTNLDVFRREGFEF